MVSAERSCSKHTGVFGPGNTAAQRKVHVLRGKKRTCLRRAMSPDPREKVTGKPHRTQAGAELEDRDPIHGRGPQGTSRVPPHHTPSLTHRQLNSSVFPVPFSLKRSPSVCLSPRDIASLGFDPHADRALRTYSSVTSFLTRCRVFEIHSC